MNNEFTTRKIKVLDRIITKKLKTLLTINSIFIDSKNGELSLLNKYIKTEKTKTSNHQFEQAYKVFKAKKQLSNYKYKDFKDACDNLISLNISMTYIKYRRFIDNNIFNSFKQPLDYNKLKLSISKIEEILKSDIWSYKIVHSQYTEEFLKEIIDNNILNKDNILSLANIINLKYNYKLLTKKKKKGWFSFFKKNEILDEKNNLILYQNTLKDIYEEFVYNFNIINDLKCKLEFLTDIIKEDKYNEIINSLIKNDTLKETLLNYKSLILMVYNTENTFEIIKSLSNIEIDILDYCYSNVDKTSKIDLLISLIPELKLYLEIEEEELNHMDVINIYKDYDNLIISIYDDLKKRSSLISNSINNILDDLLREESPSFISNSNDENKIDDHYIFIYKEIEEFLINKYNNLKIVLSKDYLEVISKDKRILIKISPNRDNNIFEDIVLYKNCNASNINLYRLWYRDWWLDKFKELKNIEKFIIE